ncbi:MAG: hypothetical protein E6Q59_07030, partial [Nitrosomonas sp.]
MNTTLKSWLNNIITNPLQHARWLNTLSYLENCGAKLLAGCEHPTMVREEMLKHASEEFRHAYYLKNQITKVWPQSIETYQVSELLGGYAALHYLSKLNVRVSKRLKERGYSGPHLRSAAYALVSYAIEVRAESLYPSYQEALMAAHSKVSVRSIIIEEAEHLQEMKAAIALIPDGTSLAKEACTIENSLWKHFLE